MCMRAAHIYNHTIRAPGDSHNTDGWDLSCSQEVLLEDSYYSGGDDCVSVKSGVDWFGRTYGRPSANITVRHLSVGTAHGLSIGSEMSGGVTNVTFEHIVLNGTGTGIRMKSQRGRGGLVSNSVYRNISMVNVGLALQFTLNYHPNLPPTNATATPRFDGILVEDVVSDGATVGYDLNGLPESNITNIQLRNLTLTDTGKELKNCQYVVGVCDDVTPCPPCL
jgi:polygalacturonase